MHLTCSVREHIVKDLLIWMIIHHRFYLSVVNRGVLTVASTALLSLEEQISVCALRFLLSLNRPLHIHLLVLNALS